MSERLERHLRAPVITIKVGSSLLIDPDGRVRDGWLRSLANDIDKLRAQNSRVIIVTSGAIALGRRIMKLPKRDLRLEEKQAAAATGQIELAGAWRDALAASEINTAQILLTMEDTEARRRYLNAKSTIETLLQLGVIPVVNENDTVATSEIRFGDNDRLSARVAIMASAETLILLSDIDGLYTSDPTVDPTAQHIPSLDTIGADVDAMAGVSQTEFGTGGMKSKISAARLATRAGTSVILCRGNLEEPITALRNGGLCTVFEAKHTPQSARKQWIGASLGVQGTIYVDQGAAKALREGASLLPAGVSGIEGVFGRGDAVIIVDPNGLTVAKGLSCYDSQDAMRIRGKRSSELPEILGWRGRDALVHRDDLVLL